MLLYLIYYVHNWVILYWAYFPPYFSYYYTLTFFTYQEKIEILGYELDI